jgi:hypothetical protein
MPFFITYMYMMKYITDSQNQQQSQLSTTPHSEPLHKRKHQHHEDSNTHAHGHSSAHTTTLTLTNYLTLGHFPLSTLVLMWIGVNTKICLSNF